MPSFAVDIESGEIRTLPADWGREEIERMLRDTHELGGNVLVITPDATQQSTVTVRVSPGLNVVQAPPRLH